MRFMIHGAVPGFGDLPANTASQLGWHPPLEITKQDVIAEEIFEKKGEKLPVGFFVHALKVGRTLNMITLEKTHNDLSAELNDIQNLLSDIDVDDTEGERKVLYGIKYNEILLHDLEVVASALNNGGYASDSFLIKISSTIKGGLQDGALIPYEHISDISLEVVTPHANDVVFGIGNAISKHIGNVRWKILVATNKMVYNTLAKNQKTLLARSIVMAIRNQSPPGKFLQKDPGSKLWYDIGIQSATEKTSQALRENQESIDSTHRYKPRRPRPVLFKQHGRNYSTTRNTRVNLVG